MILAWVIFILLVIFTCALTHEFIKGVEETKTYYPKPIKPISYGLSRRELNRAIRPVLKADRKRKRVVTWQR